MRELILASLALAGGLTVGIGAAALLVALAVAARLARATNTGDRIPLYSGALAFGVTVFTLFDLFDWRLGLPLPVASAMYAAMGAFVGMQACALAEVLDALPHTLGWMPRWGWRLSAVALALGKASFSVLDLVIFPAGK